MVNEGSGHRLTFQKRLLQGMAVHQISLAFWTKLSFLLIFTKPEAALETKITSVFWPKQFQFESWRDLHLTKLIKRRSFTEDGNKTERDPIDMSNVLLRSLSIHFHSCQRHRGVVDTRSHEDDVYCPSKTGCREEYQEDPVQYHRHVFPVFHHLKKSIRLI